MLLLAGVYAAAAARVDDTPLTDRTPPPRAVDGVGPGPPTFGRPDPGRRAAREQLREAVGAQVQAQFEQEVNAESLRRLRTAGAAGVVGLALVSLVIGWFVSGRVLAPVARITDRARELGDQVPDLSGRIALGGPHDELRELADTLDGFLDRTQRAVDGQRRFLADASHELRTPIAAAKTSLQVALADEGAEPTELRRVMGVAERQLTRMGRIVGDLLVLERASASRGSAEERVDLQQALRESADEWRVAAEDAGVTLAVAPGAAAACAIGREAAHRVIGNLLENAVRYNRPGGRVQARVEGVGAQIRLVVADTGRGIPEDERERVFERFHRAARDVRGTGLGLAIVRELVTAADGTIALQSEPGSGTTVTVELPAA